MTAALVTGLILSAFHGVGPLFAQLAGLDWGMLSAFMSATIIRGLVLQYPVGRFSDGCDQRQVMLGVVAGFALVSFAFTGKDAHHGKQLLVLGNLFGGLAFTLYPLCVA